MRDSIRQLKSALRFFYTLGVAYHGWGVLVALAGGLFLLWNRLRASPVLGDIALVAAVGVSVIVVVLAPALFLWLRNQGFSSELSNPSLELVQLRSDIEVTATSYTEHRYLDVRAQATVGEFQFNVGATGGLDVSVELLAGGTLIGPMARRDRQHYHVHFHPPLEKGRERSIELVFAVVDPEKKMKPFSRESITGFRRVGSLRQRFNFRELKPIEVFYEEEHSIGSGVPIPGTLKRLTPDANGSYAIDIPDMRRGRAYVVNWML